MELVRQHGFDMDSIQLLHTNSRSIASLRQRFYKLCRTPGLESVVAHARRTGDYSHVAGAWRQLQHGDASTNGAGLMAPSDATAEDVKAEQAADPTALHRGHVRVRRYRTAGHRHVWR